MTYLLDQNIFVFVVARLSSTSIRTNCSGCVKYDRVDTLKWSSRYVEMEVSRKRKNIMVESIRRNGGVKGEQEYSGRVDT